MLHIDGSQGEGGRQVLRTTLAQKHGQVDDLQFSSGTTPIGCCAGRVCFEQSIPVGRTTVRWKS
jgi:hypothetical protein